MHTLFALEENKWKSKQTGIRAEGTHSKKNDEEENHQQAIILEKNVQEGLETMLIQNAKADAEMTNDIISGCTQHKCLNWRTQRRESAQALTQLKAPPQMPSHKRTMQSVKW